MSFTGRAGRRARSLPLLAAVTAVMVCSGLLQPMEGVAHAATKETPQLQRQKPVKGKAVKARKVNAGARVAQAAGDFRRRLESADDVRSSKASIAPQSAGSGLGLLAGRPAGLGQVGVRVARASSGKVTQSQAAAGSDASAEAPAVSVSVLSDVAASRLGIKGLALEVASGTSPGGDLLLDVDYSAVADAFGADWTSRIRAFVLPACAASSPHLAECRAGVPIAFRNHPAHRRVVTQLARSAVAKASAQATSSDATTARSATALSASGYVVALAAGASGATGDYSATPLSPSATWQAGTQTGSFTWSYPLRVPPGVNGPSPKLGISYDSGAVDGRTASTNNQPSWVGDGFSLDSGYVERRYVPCAEDMTGSNTTVKTGDLCWRSDNASIVLAGHSGELLYDATQKIWKLKNDDGSRIERRTGAFNADKDKQYWVLTTSSGAQYYFGLGRRYSTDTVDTKSVQTVPVASNQSGEPYYVAGNFAGSFQTRAYRWNLDYVVDVNGNTMTYFYEKAGNRYRRDSSVKSIAYDRDAWPVRIEYGQRKGSEAATQAPARVVLTAAERCIPTTGVTCAESELTASTAGNWPDTPFEQICTSTTECGLAQTSPTFFTRKRLASVTTQVLSGSAYTDVDSWTLAHSFPATGDGTSPSLWLTSIQHSGKVGTAVSLESVTFDGIQLRNRVDGIDDSQSLIKWRVNNIVSEAGGALNVTYMPAQCTPTTLPQPESNTTRCFPSFWTAPGGTSPTLTWFNKYPVSSITEQDLTGSSPSKVTSYEYVGGGAWHYDDNELTKPKNRTYSDWRGYGAVRVRTGPTGAQSLTETRYMRGMHGDRLPGGAKRSVSVTDSLGGTVVDSERANGFALETITYNGSGGAEVSGTINRPWISAATGTDGTDTAYLFGTKSSDTRVRLSTGSNRTTRTTTVTFDGTTGTPIVEEDSGDIAVTGDEQCTRTTLVKNTTLNILTSASRVEVVSKGCSATTSRPADVVKDTRMYYDGATSLTAAPTRGLVTKVEELDRWDATAGAVYATASTTTYDTAGRLLTATDASGNVSKTAYTPASGGPVTGMTTTNPKGWTSTTTIQPAWGQPVTEVDVNGKRTDLEYDGLGRLKSVWLPGRSKAAGATPSMRFGYTVRRSGANWVASGALDSQGQYVVSYSLFDGLLRRRQTQTPAFGSAGGRIITERLYDGRGFVVDEQGPFWTTGSPSGDLFSPTEAVEARTNTDFDGAGRPTRSTFYVNGVEKSRTTTTYGGDRVTTIPPAGDTPTVAINDARGRLIELRQYKTTPTASSTVADYDKTTYTYTPAGQIKSLTGPPSQAATNGSVWSYEYDLRGRLSKANDPVKGVSTMTYTPSGLVQTTTDSRNTTLYHGYDSLGRETELRSGSSSGTVLVSRAYDTLLKGVATSTTRQVGSSAYVTAINGYDDMYRPTSTSTTIPASEGALAGTYTTAMERDPITSDLTSMTYPAAGGLAAEKVTTAYGRLGDGYALTGLDTYVGDTARSPFGEALRYGMGPIEKRLREWFTYEEGTRRRSRWFVERDGVSGYDLDVAYSYDAAGNLLQAKDSANSAGSAGELQCYTYDYLRRLTRAWTPKTDCATAPSVANLGGPAPYWQAFSYDAAGNRLTDASYAAAGTTTRAYVYGKSGGGQADTLRQVTQSGPSGTRLEQYTYDAAGNQLTRDLAGTKQSLVWDAEGHLSSLTEGTKVTSFVYDAAGERLIRRDPDGSSTLYLDGQELRLAKGATAPKATRYYSFDGETVAVRTAAGLSYVLGDSQGTGVIEVDVASWQVSRRRFTPFGEARGAAPSVPWVGERGFVDGTLDPSTGLTHLGAREYDPKNGRFLSLDPLFDQGDPKSWNGYSYADNNPVVFSDPDGRNCHSEASCAAMFPKEDPNVSAAKAHAADVAEVVRLGAAGASVKRRVADAETKQDAQKERVVRAAKELIKIAADELGITAGIDCFTKGDLGACAETAVTVLSSFVGGLAGKLLTKYALKWKKAARLIKALWRIGDEIADAIGGFMKARKELAEARKFEKALAKFGDSCAVGNSFTGVTRVVMADGSSKPIKDVKLGDKVLAADPVAGVTRAETVVATIHHGGPHTMVDVKVAGGGSVTATDGHPFWNATTREWARADHLKAGQELLTSSGATLGLTSAVAYSDVLTAYNLTVTDLHTYYVIAGPNPILVHNSGGLDGCGPSPSTWLPGNASSPEEIAERSAAWGEHYRDMNGRAAQAAVRRGQQPRQVARIDGPEEHVPGSQWHAQGPRRGSPGVNMDGSFHDGNPGWSEKTLSWLRDYGWNV